ncbi:MAG: Na/Pi cotransporter family protein [Bacteroidales bacterium]|nr:Na/Pi cotransporter family protein [Bacteroidales bacterium]
MFLQLLTLIGALGMFLYGMNLMSAGLQKSAGDKLRNFLSSMTSSPFKGVLTGLGITTVIQSSSATTVMVVSFVNAGLLTLTQAISVIMGANIGTTVTAWLVSWLGFKADISVLAVPLMAIGFILSISKKDHRRNISELIVGFSLLFLGLSLMKLAVPDLSKTPELLSFIQGWQNYGFGSVIIFLVFGTLLTLVLQSSSASMAITLIMLNMGWIRFDMACAIVLGENIGTTITANIAAAVGNKYSKRAALAHTVFNLFGVIWALITFPFFLKLIGFITSAIFAVPDPAAEGFTVVAAAKGAMEQTPSQTAALFGLSMLHTLFNTINTFILIWFIPTIEKLVCSVIKDSEDKEQETFALKYMDAGPVAIPELSTEQAFNEIINFANVSRDGLKYVTEAILEPKPDNFALLSAKLVEYEEIADRMELEIEGFLNSVSAGNVSEETSAKIKAMSRIIEELESLGDSGKTINNVLMRRNVYKKTFDKETLQNLALMADSVDNAYQIMIDNLKAAHAGTLTDISKAHNAEAHINTLRNYLRDSEIEAIENGSKNYQSGSIYYIDLISILEQMGDSLINISKDLENAFRMK